MKKRFLGIICLLYSSAVAYTWITNTLKNYLSPSMQIYLKVSMPILVIMGYIICSNKNIDYKFKKSDIILIIPIILLILSGDGRLTASFSKNRMSNFEKGKNDIKIQNKKQENKETNKQFDYEIVDEVYMDLSNFITFAKKQKQFIGKTIRIRGFVNKQEQYVPKGYFAIGKYGVSCCTADAGFVGFFVKETEKVKENKWYEIEGILEKAKDTAGYNRIAIHINKIKEIDSKKEEEYVYPCYAYKDGKCEEMKKYNFEY